jgi:hypothetical protein
MDQQCEDGLFDHLLRRAEETSSDHPQIKELEYSRVLVTRKSEPLLSTLPSQLNCELKNELE